jgi:hypothetical protein
MLKWILMPMLTLFFMEASAAFVPAEKNTSGVEAPATMDNIIRELSVQEFEKLTGEKMNGLQKWQYKRMQKKLTRNAGLSIIPERDELTEGFQALPFFGSLLTLGIVYLVMVFTARDRNALRWAGWGLTVAALAFTVAALIGTLSGY